MSEPNKPPNNPNNKTNTEKSMNKTFFIIYLLLKDEDYIQKLKGTIHERHLEYDWKNIRIRMRKKQQIAKIYWALVICRAITETNQLVRVKFKWNPPTEKIKGEMVPTVSLGDFKIKYRSDASMKGFARYQLEKLLNSNSNSNIGE